MKQPRFPRSWRAVSLVLAAVLLAWHGYHVHWRGADDRSSEIEDVSPVQTDHPASDVASVSQIGVPLLPSHEPTRRARNAEDRVLKMLRRRLAGEGVIPNEALLEFETPEALEDFLARSGRTKVRVIGRLDGLSVVRVGFDRLEELSALIGDDASLQDGIGANYLVEVPRLPEPESRASFGGDTPFGGDGFLAAIGADGDRSLWGRDVTVAVVDTGVEDHPTFGAGQISHTDLVNDGQPFDGHGTAMAGLIGGNDPRAPGVAPGTHILDMRVADGRGLSSSFVLAAGIMQAADAGAEVINISLGSYGDAAVVRGAVAYAESMGSVVVGSAGNDQTADRITYPAAIASVISVGGVDASLQQAYFSNSGDGLDIAAPGVGIQSAYGKNQVVLGDGTSQAAAITSGVVAYGLSTGATTTGTAAEWLAQNALPLGLSPESAGAGMTRIPPP